MNKIIVALLSLMVVLSGCGSTDVHKEEAVNTESQEVSAEAAEKEAVEAETEAAETEAVEATATEVETSEVSTEAGEEAKVQYEFTSEALEIDSREVKVPATVVIPVGEEGQQFPFVVMAHGHGGMRDVAGSYQRVAEGLAKNGIASIRMDFSGCGESKESFKDNNISNMLADVTSSIDYMKAIEKIDGEKVAVIGYSMGGRIAILSTENHDFDAMVLWAPAGTDGNDPMIAFLDGEENYGKLKSDAEANGSVMFTTRFGQEQELGKKFFEDLESTKPLEVVAKFKSPMLVINGSKDDIVEPRIPQAIIDSATEAKIVESVVIDGADHGLGIYSNETNYTDVLENSTVDFIIEHLSK